jgi:hypothetical protein
VEPLLRSESAKTASIKTVRNKLKNLEYFCNFVCEMLSNQNSDETAGIIKNLEILKKSLPNWRKSLRSKCTIEEVHRRSLDGTDNVAPTDISRYLRSD